MSEQTEIQLFLEPTWPGVDIARAKALFPNQGLHNAARAVAAAGPRAVEYLEQAPVIIAGIPIGTSLDHMAMAHHHRISRLVAAGAPLKDIMAAYGLPYVLRKIRASAITPNRLCAIAYLCQIDQREVGNFIPKAAGTQAAWLQALATLIKHSRTIGRWQAKDCDFKSLFRWAIRQQWKGKRDGVTDVVDYAIRGSGVIKPDWSRARVQKEVDAWHERLRTDDALKRFGVAADAMIDPVELPAFTHGGFTFVQLRTPRQLFSEGVVMHHCVATYASKVQDRRCHIVSIRDAAGARVSTAELMPANFYVEQHKGRFNAAPGKQVNAALAAYCNHLREECGVITYRDKVGKSYIAFSDRANLDAGAGPLDGRVVTAIRRVDPVAGIRSFDSPSGAA